MKIIDSNYLALGLSFGIFVVYIIHTKPTCLFKNKVENKCVMLKKEEATCE